MQDSFTVDPNSFNNILDVTDPQSPFTVVAATSSIGATVSVFGGSFATQLDYTPPADTGNITDIVNVTIFDGDVDNFVTVAVFTNPLLPFEAVDDAFTIASGSPPTAIDVFANDIGEPIILQSFMQGNNGGTVTDNGSTLVYTLPATATGGFTDTFAYTITDEDPSQFGRLSFNRESSATVTITVPSGPTPPPPPPPTGEILASNDDYRVDVRQGSVNLPILTNDSGDDIFIDRVGGNIRGFVSVNTDRLSVRYTPPINLIGSITETFLYVISNRTRTLEDTAEVTIVVTGRGVTTTATPGAPLPPAVVPTSSIGKIRSDLPSARALENLCDLLTFRSDPQQFSNDPRPVNGLNPAELDLRNCACAVVNESDPAKQRNALNQLSGGQHQFSDTVIRFAKANAGVIARRMSDLRKIVTGIGSSPVSSLNRDDREQVALARLRETTPSLHTNNSDVFPDFNQKVNPHYVDYQQDPGDHVSDTALFDTLSVSSNSSYISIPLGGAAGDEDGGLFGDQWGMFASVNSGSGDSDDNEFEFDFTSYDITVGLDTTRPDGEKVWIYGGALSIGKIDTDTRGSTGTTESDTIGITLYSSLFAPEGRFYDAALGYAMSDIDITRAVNFNVSGKSVFQDSTGDTEADELSLSLGGGKEFSFGANTLTASGRLHYVDGKIDGLTETIQNPGAGTGVALQTDDFDFTSFRSEIGVQLSRAISTNFGVVLPYADATWVHEFEDRGTDIQARFVVDPYSNGFDQLEEDLPGGSNRPTLFTIPGEENDTNYARLSLGSSFSFANSKTAWISISTVAGLDDINSTTYTAGFRWNFGN